MEAMAGLAKPTIHLNGTSREALLESYLNAMECVSAAIRALTEAAPNGRDYYTQGPGAIKIATSQHVERLGKLREVHRELTEIAEAIAS